MKSRILIVDDSSMSRRIVRGILESSTREMAEQAGSRGFVTKPIRKEELLSAVNSGLEALPL